MKKIVGLILLAVMVLTMRCVSFGFIIMILDKLSHIIGVPLTKFAGAEFTDDGMYEFPGSYERENYYDEYIVDDAALKEQLVEMFYREVE